MVIQVRRVEGNSSWLTHEERDKSFGWYCPECKVRYLWSQSWSYAGPIANHSVGYICLDCAHRLGFVW